jgi:hypothetical protein
VQGLLAWLSAQVDMKRAATAERDAARHSLLNSEEVRPKRRRTVAEQHRGRARRHTITFISFDALDLCCHFVNACHLDVVGCAGFLA